MNTDRPESNFDQLLYILVEIALYDTNDSIDEIKNMAKAGIKAASLELRIYRDGQSWVCTGLDFINLQESKAAFGNMPLEAIEAYQFRYQRKINECSKQGSSQG